MSETRTYRGKFSYTGLTVEEFVEDNIKYLPDCCKDESLREKFYEIVFEMTNDKEIKAEDFFEYKGLVYEVTSLEDLEFKSFIEIDRVKGEFITSFYDGATSLSEMLAKGMGE